MTQSGLIQHNPLIQLENGVWVKTDESDRTFIDYTDGDETETTLHERVKAAKDRSVFSEELDQAWEEWAMEYHLGSKRSNVYRGLNLEGVKTVLEVGCGCGAITRFLGEQGYHVDAIEGALPRAQIARLRCAELDNVQIVSSNYHALELAAQHYDLIVFTGVLEYSGAYTTEKTDPEAQLKKTLQQAYEALSEDGQIFIAIENRTGFKYLAGASEDHLNVPNIGLLGYPEPLSGELTRGIRTWSKRQWQDIFSALELSHYCFCYPFPDYKVPDAILSDHFLNNAKHPAQVLGGIFSRDYFAMWQPRLSETRFWHTASQTHSLDEFANSFLIVLGKSAEKVKQTVDFDFVRFASIRRKPAYRFQVSKKSAQNSVQRVPLFPNSVPESIGVTQIHIEDEPFVDGQVLEQLWHQALSVVSSYEELSLHIQKYSNYLDEIITSDTASFVDALPQNIIVDEAQNWHLIDQEWRAVGHISKEIIMFRALFHFALNARDVLADMELNAFHAASGIESIDKVFPLIQTIDDFVRWGFEQVGLDYKQHREDCLQFETRMYEQVSRPLFNQQLEPMLATPIYQWHLSQPIEQPGIPMEVRAYWSQVEGIWHLDHSVSAEIDFEYGINVQFTLPEMLTTHRYLRLDPAAEVLHVFRGWLEFRGLSLSIARNKEAPEQVYTIETAQDLFARAKLNGLRKIAGDRLMITASDANIVLDLNSINWGDNIDSITLELLFDNASDKSMLAARSMLRDEAVRAAYRVRLRQHILDRYQERITELSDTLNTTLKDLEKKIDWAQQAAVASGRLDRLLRKIGLMRTPPKA